MVKNIALLIHMAGRQGTFVKGFKILKVVTEQLLYISTRLPL